MTIFCDECLGAMSEGIETVEAGERSGFWARQADFSLCSKLSCSLFIHGLGSHYSIFVCTIFTYML